MKAEEIIPGTELNDDTICCLQRHDSFCPGYDEDDSMKNCTIFIGKFEESNKLNNYMNLLIKSGSEKLKKLLIILKIMT